ncbi:MAG: hypothetical protein K2O01_04215, partial [Bacteroidales bacterium]|nr:hypothetical protein [Bacteroidales bacterium]
MNSVLHFEPLEKLPYFADLRTEAGRQEVGYNPDFWKPVEDGSLNALKIDPLVTRCMVLEAGERYRFIFEYKAGFTGFLIGPDIFNIVYGPSDKPVSEWDTLKRYTANTKYAYVRDEIEFEQKESGSYSFGICLGKNSGMNYQGTFFITGIRIEKIYDYDIQVSKVQATLARYMPARHALRPTFNVTLVNRGEKDVEKVKLTVKNGAEQIAVSEEKAIKRNDTVNYVFDGTLARPAVNNDVTLMVMADMEHADENPEDNEKAFLFTATDTLYAFDDVTIEEYENGVGLQGFLLGNLFTLLETDTLTSVTLGWMDLTAFPLEPLVRMEMYAVAETGETGECIYASDIERPKAGGVQTVAIPPRVLAAGRYLIGVRQVGVDNMTLGYDGSPTGFFYVRRGNRVQTLSGYGNMALRANFGKTDRAYAKDIEILEIERPMERGVFAANEKIVVNYRNNGHENLDVEFRCKVDGNDISQMVEVPAYAIGGQVVFEADLSRKGAHDITVEAVLAGDENPENNAVKKTIMCIEEDPYVMDFELCNDFATDLFPWTSVDVDLGYTAGIYGYDWPGCMAPMGFMAFNPHLTTPSIEDKIVPYDGERMGAAFVSSEGVNNDWLISPKLKLPEQDARLSFYTRAFSEIAERYNVLVSVT